MNRDPEAVRGVPVEAAPSAFDREVSELAATFVGLPADAMDAHIERAIGRVAEFFDLDRATVGQRPWDGGTLHITHQWVREGCARIEPWIPEEAAPWITARISLGEPVVFSSPEDLPPEARRDQEFIRRIGTRSNVTLPLHVGGSVVGWLAFGALRAERAWSSPMIEQLELTARILGDALARKQAEQALRRALEFERLLATLSAIFVHRSLDAMDSELVRAIGQVADFLGADRANICRHIPAERVFVRTHHWVRDGVASIPVPVPEEAVPWLMARVLGGREFIFLSSLDELPPEAARDRVTLEQLGEASGAIAPLVVEDRVLGFLSFSSGRPQYRWPRDLIVRFRLVAEVVASALAREEAEGALRRALAENERLQERLKAENVYLQEEVHEAHDFGEFVGQSASVRAALAKVDQVAASDAPVLLVGETGTGKELLARAIHARSHRSGAPLIAVNCAALPATLIESELFGHEKGAFTGATYAKPGRFDLADGGTLFLDEIGDLDPMLQTKLLRVLQDGEFQRLGSTVTRKVDVRIVSATNRDLKQALAEGRFRPDLYYRLAVIPIEVAPLRERRGDIPLLVWHCIQSRQRSLGRLVTKVPRPAMEALVAYDWPGNVRELQNVIERALILSRGSVLRIEEVLGAVPSSSRERSAGSAPDTLQETERAHIIRVLERCSWAIEGRGQTAERLGLRPSTLRNRMKKLGIRRPAR